MLDVFESLEFLKQQGLPVVKSFLAGSRHEAVFASRAIGYPVVMKLVSPKAVHKTDIGGVITGIHDELRAKRAYDELIYKSEKLKIPLRGVLVQEQFSGVELIIGVKKDHVFNQVIMIGVGGIFVELLKDVSFRVCPVNKKQVLSMINELRANKLLKGYRGVKGVNIDKLAGLISKVSRLAVDKDLIEMDINPIIMKADKALIVDARIKF